MNGHGGARPGAGKPKGHKSKSTLTKEFGRQLLREMVLENLKPMVQAQMAASRGIWHVYTRLKNGRFERIETPEMIDALLTGGTERKDYWIFQKDPSTAAFTDLLNRALDKPMEQVAVTGADGGPVKIVIDKPW